MDNFTNQILWLHYSDWPIGWYGGLRTYDILCASIKYVSGITSSDMRLKTNIETYNRGVTEVMRLRPVSFVLKDQPNKGTHYGFIAQEVEEILPELIVEDAGGFTPLKNSNGTPFDSSTKLPVTTSNDAPVERPILNLRGYKSIKHGIDAILVNCIQEQQEMIETLQNTLKTLEARLDAAGL